MAELVDRSQVQGLVAAGAQLVDVLPPAEYDDDHLPGAISVPLAELARRADERLERNRPVVVYCHNTI